MIFKTKTTVLFFVLLLNALLSACSTMPSTQSGFLSDAYSDHAQYDLSKKIEVFWKASSNKNISKSEEVQLASVLKSSLQKRINESEDLEFENSSIKIRAAITRIEAISPVINWITTILVFVPLDHGGAAVELEAIDTRTNRIITQLSFSQWVPLSEFSAHFNRLAPAKIALASAAGEFIDRLSSSRTLSTASN